MTIYAEPSGLVPQPDANGRLILVETRSHQASQWCLGFLFFTMMAVSGLYATLRLKSGVSPLSEMNNEYFVFAVMVVLIGAVLCSAVIRMMLFPPKLEITDDGVCFTGFGKTKDMGWNEIESITLKEVVFGRGQGHVKRATILSGSGKKIEWWPVFGVSPVALAQYLLSVQNKNSTKSIYSVREI